MNTELNHRDSESIEPNFRRLVEQELEQRTSDNRYRQILSKPGNQIAWLRTLIAIDRDVANQGEVERAALHSHPGIGDDGGRPTREYMIARREHAERKTRRATFRKHLHRRIADAQAMIGHNPVTDGMIANMLVDVDLLLESGNLNDARGRLQGMLRRLDNAA